jgi:hypothetical protein
MGKPADVLKDRQRLADAIAASQSLSEAIRHFGLEATGKRVTMVRRLVAEYGIPTEHFDSRDGYGPYSFSEVEAAVRLSTSVAETMRRLGMNYRSSHHPRFAARLVALGIDTNHFTGSGWNKGIPSNRRKTPDEVLCRKPQGCDKEETYILRRVLLEIGVPEVCVECGQRPEWNGKPLTLEIDHIDGDNLNDERENLRFLCPNCHSQTPTYRTKNIRKR